jgi:hypothetical protein
MGRGVSVRKRIKLALKCLAGLAIASPFLAGIVGSYVGGANVGIGWAVLSALGLLPVIAVVAIARGLAREYVERRDLRRCLESPAFCRMMSKPSLAGLVPAVGMFICAAPFLLIATMLVAPLHWPSSRPEPWYWAGVAGLVAGSLFLQWIGMLRVGDYLLARRGWLEARREEVSNTPPANP